MELDRDQWLADRKLGIGASEAAAVCGVDPFRSAYQLWAEKCGLIEPDDLSENEAVEWGVRLEPTILAAFGEKTQRWVWPHDGTSVQFGGAHFLRATPDGWQEIRSDNGIRHGLVQIKTASAWKSDEWADGPPIAYQVQVQHEMLVCSRRMASLVVLIGGQRLRYFDVERDDKFIAALIEREREFWRCVETRTPPPVDGSEYTRRVLERLHPDDDGSTVALPDELMDAVARLAIVEQQRAEHREREKELDSLRDECTNRIRAAIGSATYAVAPDGTRFSYKTTERKGYEVQATKFRTLRKVKS